MGKDDVEQACDLVLEGGVTSALIYTGLIARLSQHYRLKSLGGTSSGAASAAAGAIAQRAKLDRPTPGGLHPAFEALRGFPDDLAKTDRHGRTVLFRLFQPQEETRRGYRIIAAYLAKRARAGRFAALRRALVALLCAFPGAAVLGALPGVLLSALAVHAIWQGGGHPLLNGVSVAFGAGLAAFLGLAVAALWALASTLRGMVRNHFGLCNGMHGAENSDVLPLTLKLHELFNGLFGWDTAHSPVTFAHLWGADENEREIDLQVITTALNLRRPFRLPNDPGNDPLRAFFYDPREWKELFPPSVMDSLEKSRRLRGGPAVTSKQGRALLALPEPRDWPVLVAVRLSLSFPGLLSAVPMYVVERQPRDEPEPPPAASSFVATKVYFSDGGITSNCPVHLFDRPLPSHPTFAVRLDEYRPGKPGHQRIDLPEDDAEPAPAARPFASRGALATAVQFVLGIVDTARLWRDQLQRTLPGYRERIVVVALKADEGGLNLAMPKKTILRVAALGARAASRLHEAYGRSRMQGPNAWDRHRWLRLRSTLAATQRYLGEVNERLSQARTYPDLLDMRPPLEPRLADAAATAQAKALLADLAEAARADEGQPERDLSDNASQPSPWLHMSPPW